MLPLRELRGEETLLAIARVALAEVLVDLQQALLDGGAAEELRIGRCIAEKSQRGGLHAAIAEGRGELAKFLPARCGGGDADGEEDIREHLGDSRFADERHAFDRGLRCHRVVMVPIYTPLLKRHSPEVLWTSRNVVDVIDVLTIVLTFMPSLWKHPNSPFWTCCYAAADGRRLKKSTKQTSHRKGMEVCLSFQRAEEIARQGILTETKARQVISEIVERVTGEALSFNTTREWLESWLAGKTQALAVNTGKRYKLAIKAFLHFLSAKADKTIAAVAMRDVLNFRDARRATGVAPQTANHDITILGSAFNSARRQGLITANPVEAVEMLKIHNEERQAYTAQQVSALVDAADGDWKGAILLAFYTGARLGDTTNMRWESVDLKTKTILFTAQKTKKRVLVPLHPALEAQLLKTPGIGKAHLFPSLANKISAGKHGLSRQFARVMKKAGIESGDFNAVEGSNKSKGKRIVPRLSFHCLRHSFNSILANAGIPQEIRMKMTGHSSVENNKRYTHHELEPLRAAISIMPSIGLKAKTT